MYNVPMLWCKGIYVFFLKIYFNVLTIIIVKCIAISTSLLSARQNIMKNKKIDK